jgi:hypothetical protein
MNEGIPPPLAIHRWSKGNIMSKENLVYLRNARPNKIVFHYADNRIPLEHRGHRQDSVALPSDALEDATISRWVKQGQLEKISKEAYMQLGARTVDVLPNEYLSQPMRTGRGQGAGNVPMQPAEADSNKGLTQLKDTDVFKSVREGVSPKWGGDLMSTEEELESSEYINKQSEQSSNYPSKNREDTRERGF